MELITLLKKELVEWVVERIEDDVIWRGKRKGGDKDGERKQTIGND